MLTENELRDQLRAITANDYRVPDGVDYWQTSLDMLAHIGAIDAELRDDLIYTTFIKWARAELYTPDQYRALLNIALDDRHLFFGLGERDTDTVFTRSFSILLSVLPIYNHRLTPFLTQHEIRTTLDRVLDYLARETDLRGYVEVKGWAHATAHAADVLDELAQCEGIDRDGLLQILTTIRSKASTVETVFIHEEDERLAYATLSLIQRGLLHAQDVESWLRSFAPIETTGSWRDRYRLVNVKNFLRSLYFQAQHRQGTEWICEPVNETLYAISRFK
ncbi:MAG TPA: DUF2785 domain-containing protein, partial [Anaerolineae bacterium]